MRAAEAAAVVDLVSDGRLEFGTTVIDARGARGLRCRPEPDARPWGEGLRPVERAWTEDTFEADGPTWTVPSRRLHPKPLQEPHPPLWMASTSPTSHVLAAHVIPELRS